MRLKFCTTCNEETVHDGDLSDDCFKCGVLEVIGSMARTMGHLKKLEEEK